MFFWKTGFLRKTGFPGMTGLMRNARTLALAATAGLFSVMTALPAAALPADYETGLQAAASPVMEQIEDFHRLLLWIIIAVCIFVAALLMWVVVRYRAGANPVPSKVHHNTILEPPGSCLDHHPGGHPGDHRGSLLPPAVFRSGHSQAGPDHQGDRQAVVLEL
jgi:hypothetical protein